MNAILLTVLALGGADASVVYGGPESASKANGAAAVGYGDEGDECNNGGGRHHGNLHGGIRGWCGPMPQSCYNPSFGCYPSTRFMHRYPAFHNYYYRSAYNYRQYFDYPWHAGLHEPTSMFSYHVPSENPGQSVPTPPVPTAGREPAPNAARSAWQSNSNMTPSTRQR
jgi:hypothetical protein